MSKKKILILIVTISVLFIATVSFLIIKNKTDKMEKFEINNNENNEENNTENNTKNESKEDNDQNSNDVNIKDNSDDNYNDSVTSEEDVVNYFEKKYDEVNNNSWDDVKDKAKEYFITIVDFIFYDGKIKGHTFNDLSSTAKLKIISIALKIDNKIEEYIPGYKETISSNGIKIYNNVKEKLVTLYLDISTEICKNHENGCNTAKEIFKDIKDNCRIGWDFVKKLVSSGTSKLKDWYEVYSGK
ncbi:MAG: hypothetical protein UFP41_04615 [Bacilli bacterium]|nr:hypothetical protein [Bacilli bacterium]